MKGETTKVWDIPVPVEVEKVPANELIAKNEDFERQIWHANSFEELIELLRSVETIEIYDENDQRHVYQGEALVSILNNRDQPNELGRLPELLGIREVAFSLRDLEYFKNTLFATASWREFVDVILLIKNIEIHVTENEEDFVDEIDSRDLELFLISLIDPETRSLTGLKEKTFLDPLITEQLSIMSKMKQLLEETGPMPEEDRRYLISQIKERHPTEAVKPTWKSKTYIRKPHEYDPSVKETRERSATNFSVRVKVFLLRNKIISRAMHFLYGDVQDPLGIQSFTNQLLMKIKVAEQEKNGKEFTRLKTIDYEVIQLCELLEEKKEEKVPQSEIKEIEESLKKVIKSL